MFFNFDTISDIKIDDILLLSFNVKKAQYFLSVLFFKDNILLSNLYKLLFITSDKSAIGTPYSQFPKLTILSQNAKCSELYPSSVLMISSRFND